VLVNPNRVGLEALNGCDAVEERLHGGLREEDTGFAFDDGLERTAPAEREHRPARCS
jgi:hypothetical protein